MAINLGDLVVSTARKYINTLADNVTNHNAFLNRLQSKGQIRRFTGGRTIAETLIYGDNSSVKWYSGYETFTPPTTQEILDAAEFQIKQLGAFISISGLEKIQNRGEEKQVDFATARWKQCEAQLKNTVGASLFSDGTGTSGKELGGLQLLVADDPTAVANVGGIAQGTHAFWRNQVEDPAAAVDEDTIKGLMNSLWLACIRGNDKPDLILADDVMYTHYWTSLQQQVRFTSTGSADAGFEMLKYKAADVVYDENCPAEHMYFLNTNSIHFRVATDRMFDIGEKRIITNADYEVIPMWLAGNLTVNNRSLNGVIIPYTA